MANKFVSSKRCTAKLSVASLNASTAKGAILKLLDLLYPAVISRTTLSIDALGIKFSVDF